MSKTKTSTVTAVESEVATEEVKEPQIIKGSAKFVFPDGSKYDGEYLDTDGVRVRQGKGNLTCGPESYSGEWHNDLMHGKGIYIFASGDIYEGQFHNGLFQGLGTYRFSDGSVYTGNWRQNNMHGQGEYVDSKKTVWSGEFFNGLFDSGNSFISLRPI